MPSPTVVAAAVVFSGDAVLIAQRGESDRFPLLWEFPGGKVEEGELPEEALVRECREELGLSVRVGALADAVYHAYDTFSVLLLFYECGIREGEPQPLGCRAVRFAHAADLDGFDFLPADREFVRRLQYRRIAGGRKPPGRCFVRKSGIV